MERSIVYRVQENPDYIKDQDTGAVLNTNVQKLKEYKLKMKQDQKIQGLQNQVAEMKALMDAFLEERRCQK